MAGKTLIFDRPPVGRFRVQSVGRMSVRLLFDICERCEPEQISRSGEKPRAIELRPN